MELAMKRLQSLKKRVIQPFLGDWDGGRLESLDYPDDTECEELGNFYAALEFKLVELRDDILSNDRHYKHLTPDILFDLVGTSTSLSSWQTYCPLCFETGDDLLRQCTERGDVCTAYVLRLNHLSRHLVSSHHWDAESPARLQLEISRLSKMSLEVDTVINGLLKELDLYTHLPAMAQANPLFRPDEINYQMYREERWETDCLGRIGLLQSLDALSDGEEGDLAKLCVDCFSVDINTQDILGRTPLHVACEQNSVAAVLALLEGGANPGLKTVYGSLPLHFAAAKGSLSICSLLLEKPVLGYDVNEADFQDNTALYYAINSENTELVRFLLAGLHKMDPNRASPSSLPPLIRAIHIRNKDLVGLLLASGADPRVVHKGCSASEYATMGSSAPIVSLMESAIYTSMYLPVNETLPG
jgi:hypothetical protein